MPHLTIKLVPGVDTNKTPTLNEMAVSYTNLVRFMPDRSGYGLVQKLGGWTRYIDSGFSGVIRELKAWSDLEFNKYLAIGGEGDVGAQVYNPVDSSLNNITPRYIEGNVASSFVATGTALASINDHSVVVVATTANLNATYNNGTSGVNATLTNAGTQAAISIDGRSLSVGNRVLVKDQSNASRNGVYTVTTVGSASTNWVLTRATDFDAWGLNGIENGASFYVTNGTTNSGKVYYCSNTTTVTVGTTAINFVLASGFVTSPGSDSVSFYTTDIPNSASYIFFPTIVNIGNVNLVGPYDIVTTGNGFLTFVVSGLTTPISKISAVPSGLSDRTVTIQFASPHTFYAGQEIYVEGVNTSSFDGTFTIGSGPTDVTTYTITYTQTGVSTAATSYGGTVNGVVNYGGVPPEFTTTVGQTNVVVDLMNHGFSVGDTFNVPIPTYIGGTTISGLYTVNKVNTNYQFEISVAIAATAVAVTDASGTGSAATLLLSDATYIARVGSSITVAGMTPSGYNGTFTVTASSAGSVTYASSETGALTVAGTVTMESSGYENEGMINSYEYVSAVSATRPDNYFYGGGVYDEGVYGNGYVPAADVGTAITAFDWIFDNWGSLLVGGPKNGSLYYWQPIGSSIENLSYMPNSPVYNTGSFVSMPQRQIIAYGSSFSTVQDPLLVRWCDLEDFTVWAGTANNQAGSYRIPTGSKIVGGMQAAQQSLLWTDLDLWSMTYIGQPYIYGFNKIGANAGLIAQKAAAQMGGVVYWMSQKQFFKLSGGGVEVIPCPVWDQVFQNFYPGVDENGNPYTDRIRAASNSQFNEITWYFPAHYTNNIDPSTGLALDEQQIGTGEVNAYAKYNVALNQWDYGYQHPDDSSVIVGRTAWIDQSVLGPPIGAASTTSTGLPVSIGDDIAFVYQHETANDADGAAMDSGFTTGYASLADGDQMTFIDQIWPDMKWGFVDEPKSAVVKITFYVSNYPGDTPIEHGPYSVTQGTQYLSVRMRGRLISMSVSSTDLGSFWRIGAIRYRYQPDGKF